MDPLRALPASAPDLKSFSFTHLLYDPSHPLSIPFTLLSLSPVFLFVAYFTLIVFTRRLTVLLLALGGVGNEVFNILIKRVVKQDRPFYGVDGWPIEVGEGYGWPSSHSQQAGFLLAWGIGYALTSAKRHQDLARKPSSPAVERVRAVRRAVYVFGLALWSVLVAYSRYVLCWFPSNLGRMHHQCLSRLGDPLYGGSGLTPGRYHLHYHSPGQIVAGYSIGVVTGAAYFTLTEGLPLYFPRSPPGRIRSALANLWEGLGGVSGWDLGDAPGGWGEGWMFADGMEAVNDKERKRS